MLTYRQIKREYYWPYKISKKGINCMSEKAKDNGSKNYFPGMPDPEGLRPGSMEEAFAVDGARRVVEKFNAQAPEGEEWFTIDVIPAEDRHDEGPAGVDVDEIRRQIEAERAGSDETNP